MIGVDEVIAVLETKESMMPLTSLEQNLLNILNTKNDAYISRMLEDKYDLKILMMSML